MIQSYSSVLRPFTEALETNLGRSIHTWHHIWCVTSAWACGFPTNDFQYGYNGQGANEIAKIIAAFREGILRKKLNVIERS